MKIYVVRHGQTKWNLEGRIQGKTNIELNEKGREQAKTIRDLIAKYDIDLIISSPLKRAKETAEIINSKLKCPIIFDKALEERGFGIFEGKIRKEIQDEVLNSHVLDNYYLNTKYGEVEPIKETCERVWGLLNKLKENYQDKNILLVTHGGTIRVINGYFEGINCDGIIENPGLNNCEIREYELKE